MLHLWGPKSHIGTLMVSGIERRASSKATPSRYSMMSAAHEAQYKRAALLRPSSGRARRCGIRAARGRNRQRSHRDPIQLRNIARLFASSRSCRAASSSGCCSGAIGRSNTARNGSCVDEPARSHAALRSEMELASSLRASKGPRAHVESCASR